MSEIYTNTHGQEAFGWYTKESNNLDTAGGYGTWQQKNPTVRQQSRK